MRYSVEGSSAIAVIAGSICIAGERIKREIQSIIALVLGRHCEPVFEFLECECSRLHEILASLRVAVDIEWLHVQNSFLCCLCLVWEWWQQFQTDQCRVNCRRYRLDVFSVLLI
jgi:hypothetical protein